MLGAWPQVSLCVRAGRRFGVLLLSRPGPCDALPCPAGRALLPVLLYPGMPCLVFLRTLLVQALGWPGMGLGLRGALCKIKNRRCAAGLILFRRFGAPPLGKFTAEVSQVPLGRPSATHVFATPPPLGASCPCEVGPCMLVLRASGCARARWPSRPGRTRCACVDRTTGARPMS